jgi:hypothetical protein
MSGRPKWIYALAALAAVLVVTLAWNWSALRARAQVGAAYGARITCSCRYVEERSMGSCKGDTEPGMWMVEIVDQPESRSVDARVPLMANRSARYRKGWGCLLDPAR